MGDYIRVSDNQRLAPSHGQYKCPRGVDADRAGVSLVGGFAKEVELST